MACNAETLDWLGRCTRSLARSLARREWDSLRSYDFYSPSRMHIGTFYGGEKGSKVCCARKARLGRTV